MNAAELDGAAAGLEELAGLIYFRIGAWQDFGYAQPPTPECTAIPPLGERSAKAIEAGHEAVRDIDQMIGQLHRVRAQLVAELRQDADIRNARVDAMPDAAAAQCPVSRASRVRPDGSAYIAAADVPTALAAIADGVLYCTDDEDCRECAVAPDGLCTSHSARLDRVPGYRALASALGGAQ